MLDDSGNLIVDEELTVDVVLTVLSGLLSEVDTVFLEVLKTTGLLDEIVGITELDELAELCTVVDDGVSDDVLTEIIGSFVDVC